MRWALGVLLLAALLAGDALATARLVTKRMNRAESAPAYSRIGSDPMAAFRLEREQLRARQEAQLNDIIHDTDADEEIRAQARRTLLDMLAHARSENTIEGILHSRGFEDDLASVSASAANVLIRSEALNHAQSAVILDLVMRQTGLTGGNVKIIPVK
jgi:stage III sporulation protein AH